MKSHLPDKTQKNNNSLDLMLLDIPQCLVSTSISESVWKNSNDLQSSILKDAGAIRAMIRLSIGVKNMDGVGTSEVFMKCAGVTGDVGDDRLRVATSFTRKNQNNNVCMTIVNLDTGSAFNYAFSSDGKSLSMFEMYLMGFYV